MDMKNTLFVLMLVLALLLAACGPGIQATPLSEESEALSVFGAYATAIEEPWDGVIHGALQKAQTEGRTGTDFRMAMAKAAERGRGLREGRRRRRRAID